MKERRRVLRKRGVEYHREDLSPDNEEGSHRKIWGSDHSKKHEQQVQRPCQESVERKSVWLEWKEEHKKTMEGLK